MSNLLKVIAVYLSKGGVGKTTLTALMGQFLAGMGYRVCVVDLDRQGSQTELFGLESAEILHRVIRRELPVAQALTPVPPTLLPKLKNKEAGELFVLQGGPRSVLAIDEVCNNPVDYGLLSNLELFTGVVGELADLDFDYVLLDMGPSDQRVALAALVESDYLLMPTDCEWLSLQRIEPVLKELALARRQRDIELLGILPVKAEYHFGRMRQSKTLQATMDWLATNFDQWLLLDSKGIVDLPHDEEWKNAIWVGDLFFSDETKKAVRDDALRFLNAVAARIGVDEVEYA